MKTITFLVLSIVLIAAFVMPALANFNQTYKSTDTPDFALKNSRGRYDRPVSAAPDCIRAKDLSLAIEKDTRIFNFSGGDDLLYDAELSGMAKYLENYADPAFINQSGWELLAAQPAPSAANDANFTPGLWADGTTSAEYKDKNNGFLVNHVFYLQPEEYCLITAESMAPEVKSYTGSFNSSAGFCTSVIADLPGAKQQPVVVDILSERNIFLSPVTDTVGLLQPLHFSN